MELTDQLAAMEKTWECHEKHCETEASRLMSVAAKHIFDTPKHSGHIGKFFMYRGDISCVPEYSTR